MPSESELLKAVLDNPDDDGPRIAYADWCAAIDNDRAAFIRGQLALARLDPATEFDRRYPLMNAEKELLRANRTRWVAPIARWIDSCEFDRGFVALVTLSAKAFLDGADQLFSAAPIQHVNLRDVRPVADELFASRHLRRIRTLAMEGCRLGDDDARKLAASPHTENLRWLSLGDNRIGLPGVEALAASPQLRNLEFLNLSGNPCDPAERYADDQGLIVDRWLPEDGEYLEGKYGPLRWLFFRGATIVETSVDRMRIAP